MSGVGKSTRRVLVQASRKPAAASLAKRTVKVAGLLDRWAPPALTILTYHRVAPREQSPLLAPTMVSATPSDFEGHLDVVSALTTPVTLDQVRGWLERGAALPERPLLVTFDDAYRDFAEHAWPRLLRRRVPALMFVATGYPDRSDRPYWWDSAWAAVSTGDPHAVARILGDARIDTQGAADPLQRFRRLRAHVWRSSPSEASALLERLDHEAGGTSAPAAVLGWSELRTLAKEGLAIGAHTVTHPLLTKLGSDEAHGEIRSSIEALRERGFGDADVFAYPGGDHDLRIRAVAEAAGCSVAMTTLRGVNRLRGVDQLRLRRLNVGASTTAAVLAAQLLGSLARSDRWAAP